MMNAWEQFMLLRITQAVEKIANLGSEESREEEMVKIAKSHGYDPSLTLTENLKAHERREEAVKTVRQKY